MILLCIDSDISIISPLICSVDQKV